MEHARRPEKERSKEARRMSSNSPQTTWPRNAGTGKRDFACRAGQSHVRTLHWTHPQRGGPRGGEPEGAFALLAASRAEERSVLIFLFSFVSLVLFSFCSCRDVAFE